MNPLSLAALLLAAQATPPPVIVTPHLTPAPPRLSAEETPPAEWLRGEWTVFDEDPSATLSLDEGSTRRDGDRVRLRIRALLGPGGEEGARYGLAEMELDCARRTARGISMQEYDRAGRVTREHEGGEPLAEHGWPEGNPISETFAGICHRTDPAEGEAE